MNLSSASEIVLDGKVVDRLSINGLEVYSRSGVRLYLHSNRVYVRPDGLLELSVNSNICGELISFYRVNSDMTRTLLDTVETDSNGQAEYTYTGTGAGSVGFVAVYDESESNVVTVDDYVPAVTTVTNSVSSASVSYGSSVTFTATVKDQHGENITSGTVTFKNGTTSLGTGSISNGVATLTKSDFNVGSYSVTAEISNVVSSAVALTVVKATPTLAFVPPTLVYSDNFSVSGTLKQGTTGLVGETVTLHWKIGTGSEQTATATTTTGGAFTFETMQTTTVSDYKFWVTYAGDTNHNSASTSQCTVAPNRETSVLNVETPLPVIYGNDATVSGTLTDNDSPTATPIVEASIAFYGDNMSTLGYATTDSNGAFTKTISGLSVGTHSLIVYYPGAEYYTGTFDDSKSIVVTAGYDSIVASADKSILSYADSEKATLYAQLMNGQSSASVSGVTVTFKQGSTTLGTATTDATGKATLSNGYTSAGVGDITITATDGSLVSETYAIHDYLWVPKLDGTETIHQVQNTTTISNGEMYGGSGYIGAFDNTGNWEITMQCKWSSSSCGVWLIKSDESSRDSNDVLLLRGTVYRHANGSGEGSATSFGADCNTNTYYTVKYTKNGNNLTIERNGVSKTVTWSLLNTLSTLAIGVDAWGGTSYIKDIVVKPL